jgi:hypothetical protein
MTMNINQNITSDIKAIKAQNILENISNEIIADIRIAKKEISRQRKIIILSEKLEKLHECFLDECGVLAGRIYAGELYSYLLETVVERETEDNADDWRDCVHKIIYEETGVSKLNLDIRDQVTYIANKLSDIIDTNHEISALKEQVKAQVL